MAQADLSCANATGQAFRQDVNNQLLALGTLQSGTTAPSTTYAFMLWADEANGLLKQRNSANNAWVTVATLGSDQWGHGRIVTGTVQATTSGTNKDFDIPSWAKKIIVCLNGVSVNTTNTMLVRLGTTSSFESTNYFGASTTLSASTQGAVAHSSGFDLIGVSPSAAAAVVVGNLTLTLCDPATYTWLASGTLGRTDLAATVHIGGQKALASALTRVQLVSAGTFDAGSVNVIYEG